MIETDDETLDAIHAETEGDALEAKFPVMMARAFNGEAKGLAGTGTFEFEVLENPSNGKVLIRLTDIAFKTENKADKTYRAMVGENEAPSGLDDMDEDDGTDIA